MSAVSEAICDMIKSLPVDFRRIEGRPGFWFRAPNPPHLYSLLVVQHSAKHHAIGVDVVSSVLNSWDKQYGRHQLIRATGLQNVRSGSGLTRMEDEYYAYAEDYIEIVSQIRQHLLESALPWFANHAAEIAVDPIVHCGIKAMSKTPSPPLDELKQILRREAWQINASKLQRQETGVLAIHLLAWADESRLHGNTLTL
jgi:hypothetical protein